jgi:hypothetical protein
MMMLADIEPAEMKESGMARLVQFTTKDGDRAVARVASDDRTLELLDDTPTVYDLARTAIETGVVLGDVVDGRMGRGRESLDLVIAEKRILPPLDHPDPAHCLVSGTGLTHLGSAESRDQMHRKMEAEGEDALSDSMKMFKWGLEGGRPRAGAAGVTPEWFYKGDGDCVVAPEQAVVMPSFAEDGGEEPEIVGLYVIAGDGTPCRLGFALGNEFSDHVLERRNYLYLAHSKLRVCSFGPELLVDDLPADIRGTSRILRDGAVVWETEFRSGEDNMSHTIANLEHHHFKYVQHRRPGDAHVHFFGAANLSFAAGIRVNLGEVFEIAAPAFGTPLRNALHQAPADPFRVQSL